MVLPGSEPTTPHARPTTVKRSMPACGLLLGSLLLAGCGQGHTDGGLRPDPGLVGDCPSDAPAVTQAARVATADLDGDGTPEEVRLTKAGGKCANVLFARTGEGYVSAALPTDAPPVSSVSAVTLPGSRSQLLAVRQDHPRGGYQVRILGSDGTALAELRHDGHSLLPFIALDVQEHPLDLACEDRSLVLTEAVPHEPRGVMFAWDVRRTAYAVDGAGVEASPTEEVADNVLPAQLGKRFPQLAGEATLFRGCTTS